jgi:hypothetical protein
MSDDIRDMLNGAFANEPPLRFERSDVIARGRRVQRKRWLLAAGSAAFSVGVLTAGILFVADLQSSSTPVQPGQESICSSQPAISSPADCVSGSPDPTVTRGSFEGSPSSYQ